MRKPKRTDWRHPPEWCKPFADRVLYQLALGNWDVAHRVVDDARRQAAEFGEAPVRGQELLDASVVMLGLPERTVMCLERAGILTVGQLLDTGRGRLLRLPHFAQKMLDEVLAAVERVGVKPRRPVIELIRGARARGSSASRPGKTTRRGSGAA